MSETGALIDMLLCGMAAGVALTAAITFWRSRAPAAVRWPMILTCLSGLCWMIGDSDLQTSIADQSALLIAAILIFAGGAVGFFWLTVMTLMEDRQLTPMGFAPAGVLMLLMGISLVGQYSDWGVWTWWASTALSMLAVLHVVLVLALGWRNDLVEGRRRLRGPVIAVCAAAAAELMLILVLGSVMQLNGADPWMAHLTYGLLLVVALLFGLLFEVRRTIFSPAPVRAGKDGSREDEIALTALNRLMAVDEFWRREGLTVGDLAAEMAMPEHRLRKLINGHLSHRNFAAFINAFRIDAARRRLADPAEARRTIAEIAYDLGFSSLNPFNRAFKEATGETPTEWRRGQMLVEIKNDVTSSNGDETAARNSATAGRGTTTDRMH